MDILFVNFGNQSDCFISTSVVKGLYREYKEPDIFCVVEDDNTKVIFDYCPHIKGTFTINNIFNLPVKNFDLLISYGQYSTGRIHAFDESIQVQETKSVFGNNYFDILYGNLKTGKNIFQVYYNIAGLKWCGESFNFKYYPKNKTKKNLVGLALVNSNLRNYVKDNLVGEEKLWDIPFKKNILRKIDEVNRCYQIITDDFLTMNLAIYLKKEIFFLKTVPYNTRLEFFNSKYYVYHIPYQFVK